ncbi:16S rRNA (guanine(966)-N(2))-methyltransferase RsmD [Rickettsia endosymbiont of Cardiosporidium cionae]|nr:16S rRNA (guanine(966)-N(2))-methyltransferase RsmD [Rickettsia endosymbiont of Cardiosporidium cionae]
MFNILQSGKYTKDGNNAIYQANILDLYCGSGSLGIEAISRGAKMATLVDNNAYHIDIVRKNIALIGEENNIYPIHSDIFKLSQINDKFDLIFIDPPYTQNKLEDIIIEIKQREWATQQTIIFYEYTENMNLKLPGFSSVLIQKQFGKTKFVLFRISDK